jgi:Xaa-Pro dipeptidase
VTPDGPIPTRVPETETTARLEALRALLGCEGLDACVFVESSALYYLTGTVASGHLVVPAEGDPVFLVRRDAARAAVEAAVVDVRPFSSLRGLAGVLADVIGRPARRLGFELDVLPARSYLRYRELLDPAAIEDCASLLAGLRRRKSAWELDRLRLAGEQTMLAQRAAVELVTEGATDLSIQIELEHLLRRAGHQGPLRFRGLNGEMHYGTVLTGPDAAVPGYPDAPLSGPGPNRAVGRGPRGFPVMEGVPVTVDLCGGLDGYVSDATRTRWYGELREPFATALPTCRLILGELEAMLTPGTPAQDLYERGLEIAEEAGFGDLWMGHGEGRVRFVGHGIGLEINEQPFLARGVEQPLEAGNVVAVEPKLVFPGEGAVGWENAYAIREQGPAELLTPGD